MQDSALQRVTESGIFGWPWTTSIGLAVIAGAAGGGGGGALCVEGLNLYGSGGGGGGMGYESGGSGGIGADGFVLFVPLHVSKESGQC